MVLLTCSTINQLRLYHKGISMKHFYRSNYLKSKQKTTLEGCVFSFFFFFCMLKYSVWPWTDSHSFLLSLDLLLVSHLDTSLIFLSEYVCSMTEVV